MEITIKVNGRMVSVGISDDVADYLHQAKLKNRSLYREGRNHWDGRGFDEYIVSIDGRFPYRETPEETVCRRETMDKIMSVLELCTDTQYPWKITIRVYLYTVAVALCPAGGLVASCWMRWGASFPTSF